MTILARARYAWVRIWKRAAAAAAADWERDSVAEVASEVAAGLVVSAVAVEVDQICIAS